MSELRGGSKWVLGRESGMGLSASEAEQVGGGLARSGRLRETQVKSQNQRRVWSRRPLHLPAAVVPSPLYKRAGLNHAGCAGSRCLSLSCPPLSKPLLLPSPLLPTTDVLCQPFPHWPTPLCVVALS